jgi:ribonuclease HII
MPDFSIENTYQGIIAGIDEVGRGPWAGPVVAAAVILKQSLVPEGINDSKKLNALKREALYDQIREVAEVGIGVVSVEEIDKINIGKATKLAMLRALEQLKIVPQVVLVDGNQPIQVPCIVQTVIKGDSISLSIAAASIIAKVTRDRMMRELAKEFPVYGWERNVGYGTKAHIQAIEDYGITSHHRKSFKPVAAYEAQLRLAS